jgi:hypothetical protein
MEQSGQVMRRPSDDLIQRATTEPPLTTRAAIRGLAVAKFPQLILAAQWDYIIFQGTKGPLKISLMDLFSRERLNELRAILIEAKSPDDLERFASIGGE